jgi:cytochrome d ubiquinol oxidase subunit II
VFVLGGAFLAWTASIRGGWVSQALALIMVLLLVATIRALLAGRAGWAFTGSSLTALILPIWAFACLWPDVLPGRGGNSLTVHAASSSHYTLVVMTVVALIFTPIVLAYQAWTYWVFRARIGAPVEPHGDGTIDRLRAAASR